MIKLDISAVKDIKKLFQYSDSSPLVLKNYFCRK